ncbi:MFS transporter [Sphingobium sp.]|uniref:MFS transporter n=1 Tax=Sphingobium sp. TaxID=1912891 RepID=UPI001A20F19B|nr:MFS transporter [Sphingobium sp.]MBJ7375252.1 MFS transporter [Sphingobium sp.]
MSYAGNVRRDAPERDLADDRAFPPRLVAWTSTIILMLLVATAYLDRQIISLMVNPIRTEFGVGDFEISLLQGFAFAVLYALCGLPLGMAVDRYPRRWIVMGGVLIWSCAAMMSGLAESYNQILVARIFVGAGEAALAPAAYSILSDLFPKRRLTFALGVFMIGALLGAEGSLAIGGYILHVAADGITMPLLGRLEAWRFAFVVTALPGFVLAALAIFIHEPARERPAGSGAGWGAVLRFMASRKTFYFCQIVGFSLVMALVYARLAWNPTFLIRTYGWSVQQAGYALGAFGFVAGIAALLLGGRIVDGMFARGRLDAHFRYYVVGGTILGLFGIATYLAPSPLLFFVGSLFIIVPLNMGAIGASAVQVATPPHLRGRISALYLMSVALLGMTLGPAVVGFLTQHVFVNDASIGTALAWTYGILGPITALLFFAGLGPMRDAVARESDW